MVDLNKDHMDELYSKIHDERQCVTSKSLCIDLGITRRNASQLLEAVLTSFNQDAECVYEVTRCVWKRTDGKSVARLRKRDVKASKSEPRSNPQGSIYSIALLTSQNGAASFLSGHVYTMTLLRDALLQQGAPPAILCPDIACDCILPAEEVRVRDTGEPRRARIVGMATGENAKNKSAKPVVKSVRSSKVGASSTSVIRSKKVNMTAASFFGSTNSSSVKKAEGCKTVLNDTKKNVKISKKSENDEDRTTEEKEEKAVTRTKRKSGKRVSTKKRKEKDISKSVGNADDFVGDEDEDDDFIKEDEQRQRRNAVAARKSVRETAEKKPQKKPQRRIPPTDDNSADEIEEMVEGAMDTYATPKTDGGQKVGAKQKKRVLEEKTTVDENGFLRTETVTVWKEMSDVEEKKANSSRPPSRSAVGNKKAVVKKNVKNMKQQGLFGFFTAKK